MRYNWKTTLWLNGSHPDRGIGKVFLVNKLKVK